MPQNKDRQFTTKTKVYNTRFFYPSHRSATGHELYRNMRVEAFIGLRKALNFVMA